jgi:hypothetical protein
VAEPQAAQPSAHPSSVAELSPATKRELATERAARASHESFEAAVAFLERVFLRASTTRYVNLARWIDPKINDPEYVAVRDSVISDVMQDGGVYKPGLQAKRDYYREQVERFVPIVEEAARAWALESIGTQTQRLFRLLTTTKPRVNELTKAARRVRATVDATRVVTIAGRSYPVATFVLPTMTGDEARESTGQAGTGGTVATRIRRMSYMYLLRAGPAAEGAKPSSAQVEVYSNLLTLMAHPRGVDIVDAYAKSAEAGWQLTSDLASETFTSIVKLQGDLVSDRTLVWRFPPAISAGVARLGLRNRAGITQFALAWGTSRKGKLEEALEIAGNALFVLDLVGGPLGTAVSDILNFVLASIGTAVSFLRDVEQDQAAAATAFAERSERLSKGSNKIGTVLQGFAAVAAGLAVPGAVTKIVGRRTTEVIKLPVGNERLGRAGELHDPRIGTRGIESDASKTSQRTASEGNKAIAGRQIEDKYEMATRRKGSEPVPTAERPRSTQPPGESAREQAQAARAVEERATRPRTPDDEFAEFEKWLREEAGATGPLTSDKLVQLYRHGSRETVAKYLRRYLMKQVAKDGVLELGEFIMKIEPGVPLKKQVDAFVKHLEGAHSMPQAFGKKLPKGFKYDEGDALVILTPKKPTHTLMDQPWKDAFNDIRKSGAKQASAQQVFDIVADGIRRTPGMAESEKATRIARLHDEMFVELGLVPGQRYDVPRILTWPEILGFIKKRK